MEINLKTREVSIKVVYYGPGLSGKTTNLEIIHEKTPKKNKGRLSSLATDQDRTLFFDYMPLELGEISGLKIRLRLFTVPGQVYYNSTRKLVLRCVDGIVFVADSQAEKNQKNIESLQNLYENLKELDLNVKNLPIILQYNKRDLPNIMTTDFMNETLNHELKADFFETVAMNGVGVFQSLKCIAAKTLKKAEESIKDKNKRAKKITLVDYETKKMAITPSVGKIPQKTPFRLNFSNNKNKDSQRAQFETTFETNLEKNNDKNKLPFKVDADEKDISGQINTTKIEKKEVNDQAEVNSNIKDDKVNLRKSNETFIENKNTQTKEVSKEIGETLRKKRHSTTLFRGSLTESSHIKLKSSNTPKNPPNEGLKDRLKNLEKFKNIFDE